MNSAEQRHVVLLWIMGAHRTGFQMNLNRLRKGEVGCGRPHAVVAGREAGKRIRPSLADMPLLTSPDGPFSVTLAPGITAPLSSIMCPRNVAVCACTGTEAATKAKAQKTMNCKPCLIGEMSTSV